MSSTATPRRSRRGAQPEGPRATFRQLLPFLFEHKRTLIVVAILSVVGAATSLVQPLLVGQVIEAVQSGGTLGILVWLLERCRGSDDAEDGDDDQRALVFEQEGEELAERGARAFGLRAASAAAWCRRAGHAGPRSEKGN